MFSQEVYLKALDYAIKAHKEHESDTKLTSVVHFVSVAMEVINACEKSKLDEEKVNLAISCSLLYDVIENTDITYDDLYVDFSETIANGVEALFEDKSLPKQEQMKKNIEMLLEQPYEVQMVKIAHVITNLSNLPIYWDEKMKKSYLKESSFVLSCLKNSNIYLSNRLKEKIENCKKNCD